MNIPKVGLALGAGAARGLAHLGVLKALMEENISIDMVSGTSAGAVVGALYCAGVEIKVMESIARGMSRKDLMDISVPHIGFIKGNRIEEMVKLLTRSMNIEELDIPFCAVSTDLMKGKKVVINRGPVYKAVRASISIPGIFIPVYSDEMVLVDGAIMDRVPICTVRDMGADIVIGVDVGFSAPKGKAMNIFDVLLQTIDIAERELLKNRIIEADILIKPYLPDIDPYRFDQVDECTKEGYDVTKAAMRMIKELIAEKFSA